MQNTNLHSLSAERTRNEGGGEEMGMRLEQEDGAKVEKEGGGERKRKRTSRFQKQQ